MQGRTTIAGKHTYGQILKSSALIGGSSLVTIAIGIIRTKAMAVLLGPAGVGLLGLYGSIADVAASFAGMGVNASGVRQIAEAVGSGDRGRIARTAIVLRRTSVVLGLIGVALLVALSGPIAVLTFGNTRHSAGVALLSLAVLFRLVSDGQAALLQGTRRIADLARVGVLGAIFGTLIGIPLVYFFREEGVVPSLVLAAAITPITAWWYARKIEIQTMAMTAPQVKKELSALLKLGSAFMASAVMMMGVAYTIRIFITREVGIDAAGLYQCAWAIGGLYVGLVLQAMGAEFYPRLTAIAHDNRESNRVVNGRAQLTPAGGTGRCRDPHVRTLGDRTALHVPVCWRGSAPAVGVPRSNASSNQLADGLHHYRQGQPAPFFPERSSLDGGPCRARVGGRKIVWPEWGWNRVLWVICLSLHSDLRNRSAAQRVSMVNRRYAKTGFLRPPSGRRGVLGVFGDATPSCDRAGISCGCRKRYLFASRATQAELVGADSAAPLQISCLVPSGDPEHEIARETSSCAGCCERGRVKSRFLSIEVVANQMNRRTFRRFTGSHHRGSG